MVDFTLLRNRQRGKRVQSRMLEAEYHNPHFPALRSNPMAFSWDSRRKPTPSSHAVNGSDHPLCVRLRFLAISMLFLSDLLQQSIRLRNSSIQGSRAQPTHFQGLRLAQRSTRILMNRREAFAWTSWTVTLFAPSAPLVSDTAALPVKSAPLVLRAISLHAPPSPL